MTSDDINTIIKEEKKYQLWVRERKNHILNMVDTAKKQKAWRALFGAVEHNDDYLLGSIF